MPRWRHRENPLSTAERAMKWTPIRSVGKMITWGSDDLPNGCSSLLGAECHHGPRGGVYWLYGIAVFAPDGTILMDRACAYRRWECIRTAYAVAERWNALQSLEAAE